jgi:hypothetical protein
MIYKVKVTTTATPEQLAALRHLGIADEPYLRFGSYHVYRAEMGAETAETMRAMEGMISVETMPRYTIA